MRGVIYRSMNNWILKNGDTETKFTSFPYAFRAMFTIVRKASEQGKYAEVVKKLSILAPLKDIHGNPRKYSYAEATKLAEANEVLVNGEINSRAFKKK